MVCFIANLVFGAEGSAAPPTKIEPMPQRPPRHQPPWAKPREAMKRERERRADAARPSSPMRGYDREWAKLRAVFIRVNPFCCVPGCGKPTEEVNHKRDVATHPHLRLEWSNLESMCRSHHSAHTVRTRGFAQGRTKHAV